MGEISDCPFCLEAGTLEGEIIARDDHCYIVESIDPVLRDSVMIMPLRHVGTPFELTEDEWRSTHEMLLRARAHLDRAAPDGYSIGWNVSEVGGQSVSHAHLHVIARFADEPMAGQGIRHALKQPSNLRETWR